MNWEIPVYEGGVQSGRAECREEGMYLRFTVRRPGAEGEPLRKAWLAGGGELLLGTLIPEEGGLCLHRSVSRQQLRALGLEKPERVELRDAGTGAGTRDDRWQPMGRLPLLPEDPVLRRALSRAAGGCWIREGSRICLRYPWRPGEKFPLEELFCFGRAQGDGFVLFWLEENFTPSLS